MLSASVVWFILGAIFILIEVLAVPGIGFLFAGLAATTLGGIVAFDFYNGSIPSQIAFFFAFTAIWWVILWTPLKKSMRRSKDNGYDNMIGTYGTVDEDKGLVEGKIGHIKWSGARMRARIRPESQAKSIANNETVWIHDSKESILYVDIVEPAKKAS